jgi:hypothetical protein
MKNSVLIFALIMAVTVSAPLAAQLEVDRMIALSGPDGERRITSLESPVDDTDAVNKAYVDNAVSASGPALPTMLSDESPTAMGFVSALYYCRDLVEGGYDDWWMATYEELTYVLSSGATFSNPSSGNNFWFRHPIAYGNTSYARWSFNLANQGTSAMLWGGGDTARVRCVR